MTDTAKRVPSSPDSADRMRYALEEIIQAADLHRGTPPWVLIPDHLIEQAKRAVESDGANSQ